MALVDHDSWDIEYEGCERLRHQLLVHLNQRQQLNRFNRTSKYDQLTASIESGLEQLSKDMKHLKVVLDNAITWETSPEEELQQRRIDWDRLTSQLREIREKFTNSSRSNVVAAASGSVWQDQDLVSGPGSSSRDTALDVEALKQRKIEMLEQQNQGLEVLSATLSRQRQLATQLGNETSWTTWPTPWTAWRRVCNGKPRALGRLTGGIAPGATGWLLPPCSSPLSWWSWSRPPTIPTVIRHCFIL
ncbi:syntaxin-8 isoform X1 [Drosophila gunungcola]|uniref:syntaxin-8 isoform X1 n=1 Tax=Drosophila gunungcola TaxID=103775 RepID=UPI0022E8FD32|nr:syntaxin-8 isoform X1 [Drosophila gunungcola]XP_052844914.1 syntaxin-8 isoform X1 [Drosophila gunungcola]XP_052844915.1 syntaxin-8 isoform X1 [Drosophila gunungcola]